MWVSMFWFSFFILVDESFWIFFVMFLVFIEYDGFFMFLYELFGFGLILWLLFFEIFLFVVFLGEEWFRFVVFCGWSIWSGFFDVEINWFWFKFKWFIWRCGRIVVFSRCWRYYRECLRIFVDWCRGIRLEYVDLYCWLFFLGL